MTRPHPLEVQEGMARNCGSAPLIRSGFCSTPAPAPVSPLTSPRPPPTPRSAVAARRPNRNILSASSAVVPRESVLTVKEKRRDAISAVLPSESNRPPSRLVSRLVTRPAEKQPVVDLPGTVTTQSSSLQVVPHRPLFVTTRDVVPESESCTTYRAIINPSKSTPKKSTSTVFYGQVPQNLLCRLCSDKTVPTAAPADTVSLTETSRTHRNAISPPPIPKLLKKRRTKTAPVLRSKNMVQCEVSECQLNKDNLSKSSLFDSVQRTVCSKQPLECSMSAFPRTERDLFHLHNAENKIEGESPAQSPSCPIPATRGRSKAGKIARPQTAKSHISVKHTKELLQQCDSNATAVSTSKQIHQDPTSNVRRTRRCKSGVQTNSSSQGITKKKSSKMKRKTSKIDYCFSTPPDVSGRNSSFRFNAPSRQNSTYSCDSCLSLAKEDVRESTMSLEGTIEKLQPLDAPSGSISSPGTGCGVPLTQKCERCGSITPKLCRPSTCDVPDSPMLRRNKARLSALWKPPPKCKVKSRPPPPPSPRIASAKKRRKSSKEKKSKSLHKDISRHTAPLARRHSCTDLLEAARRRLLDNNRVSKRSVRLCRKTPKMFLNPKKKSLHKDISRHTPPLARRHSFSCTDLLEAARRRLLDNNRVSKRSVRLRRKTPKMFLDPKKKSVPGCTCALCKRRNLKYELSRTDCTKIPDMELIESPVLMQCVPQPAQNKLSKLEMELQISIKRNLARRFKAALGHVQRIQQARQMRC